MKKLAKVIAVCCAVMLSLSMFGGCLKEDDGGIKLNPNKETINISMFVGGFGTEYMKKIINTWNEEHQDSKYQFNIGREHQDTAATAEEKINSGVVEADIYVNDDPNIYGLVNGGKLLDLGEVWDSSSDGITFRKRLRGDDAKLFEEICTGKDGKIYAMPWTQGVTGMLYDRDFFEEEGWLLTDPTTENGLTKGTDGIEGTFDDGLPQTMTEFKALCEDISDGFWPFIVSDIVNPTNETIDAIMARYIGVESFITSYTLDGNYTDPATGQVTKMTPKDGWKFNSLNVGLKKAFEFLEDFLYNDDYRDVDEVGIDHIAQGEKFLFSHEFTRIAMFFDGCWWLNEKSAAFASDVQRHGAKWSAYNRDIRFMPTPVYEGATDSLQGKSVFVTNNVGTIFAVKSDDEEKNAEIIAFLKNLVTDRSLKEFISATNCMTAYKCTLSKEELAKLTPYAQSVYETMNSDSVVLVHPTIYKQKSLFYTSISVPYYRYGITYNKVLYTNIYKTVVEQKRCSFNEYYTELCNRYDEQSWQTIYDALVF